jgi:hypothetical protein
MLKIQGVPRVLFSDSHSTSNDEQSDIVPTVLCSAYVYYCKASDS